jgi:hypothetical protein
MLASTLRRIITMDTVDLFDRFLQLLEDRAVRYCVIGGQAVNAYVEPLVSLDLDLVVAVESEEKFSGMLAHSFMVETFPHRICVTLVGSDLRIQVQTDPRYVPFVKRAEKRQVLGRTMHVADIRDVLQGKIWAAADPERRGSKRQKDLADIARVLEAYPSLREHVPESILARLV